MTRLRMFAVAGALALAMPTAALAQAGWNAPGYREGFERGRRAGAEDARRGQRYDFTDESDYRRGDGNYRSQYGSRDRYRDTFRYGFQEGYRTGFSAFAQPRRGAIPPWSDGGRGAYRYNPASQIGHNDGYEAGLDDGRDGRRYDPFGERRYRNADRGYERHYGPREVYKNQYREAFKSGYARGYADGRRHDRRSIWGGIFGFRF